MQIETYETKSNVDSLVFTFESVGEKVIRKVVEYTKLNPVYVGLTIDTDVYNLAFGDWNDAIGDYEDTIKSKNGDMQKVLATVANTAFEFWEEYPDALIFFRGSQPFGEKALRTRLYQMKINTYFADISLIAEVKGFKNDNWVEFEINKNYNAFLISQKNKLV